MKLNKKIYNDQKETLYSISKATGIRLALLYQYSEGIKNVDNMTAKTLCKISEYLKMPMNQLYHEIKIYQDKEKES